MAGAVVARRIRIGITQTIEHKMSTKTRERPLMEEIASAVVQGGAAAASAFGLLYLVIRAWPQQNVLKLATIVVYGGSMFIAFVTSAIYHSVQHRRIKAVFQKIDQCTIFLFVAGTYTPFALLPLRHHAGVTLLALIWTVAIAGIVLRLTKESFFDRVAVPLYLAMGWLCLGWGIPLYQMVGTVTILLIIAGGIIYSGGLLFYGWQRLPFSNPIWHLFVVSGSISFFFAIARCLRQ
ncbi:MAG: hemolysin III family protein [Acetobacteraceae bacterium]|jgi:hemolysin III